MVSANESRILLEVALPAEAFDEDDFGAFRQELGPRFGVGGGVTIRLAETPPIVIAIAFAVQTLQQVPANLLASALYDALKGLRHRAIAKRKPYPRHRIVFGSEVSEEGHLYNRHYASIETDNDDVLHDALFTLRQLSAPMPGEYGYEFDEETRRWKKSNR